MRNIYNIDSNDHFSVGAYPQVVTEVTALRDAVGNIRAYHKDEMIISYYKDHCIKTELLGTDSGVAKLITSGVLNTSHIESLFNACRTNSIFLREFEQYIVIQLF